MVFSSLPFLDFFLPAALLLGLTAPRKARNAVLLLLSLLFYFFGEPRFVPLLLFTAAAAWGCGL